MKISLSWIADHIKIDRNKLDPSSLLEKFSATTAEIEEIESINIDTSMLSLAMVTAVTVDGIAIECPELGMKKVLPTRKSAFVQQTYLVKKEGHDLRWANYADVGGSNETLMPALWMQPSDLKGAWKNSFEKADTLITIENKTITHRPDLWSHRGCAREMAAILEKELRPEEEFISEKPIKNYDYEAPVLPIMPFVIKRAQLGLCGQPCDRLAALFIPKIDYKPSLLWMAVRLARIDSRPLDMIVDITNYVMFDIGQPMHAFDADTITTKLLEGRCARSDEKVTLLDGSEVTLTDQDYVISDGPHVLSVAGVMGGEPYAVSTTTKSLLLESAHFDPTAIRKTATRLKKRTESSARFEKNLDPHQNTIALLRAIKLLEMADSSFTASESIISLGALPPETHIEVSHALIENRLGVSVSEQRVETILLRLGFGVSLKPGNFYAILVPSFRAKDVVHSEDIIEEVARFIGYNNIIPRNPVREMTTFDTRRIERMRALKTIIAEGMGMHEVNTYAFFDEDFLRILKYEPQDALSIENPQSERWQRLVTSLVPNLLNCVVLNQSSESLRFFEYNRVWFYEDHPVETEECAGLWYEHKNKIDFYDGKAMLLHLFNFFKIAVRWEKPKSTIDPWYDANQTAQLWYENRIVGQAGKAASLFLSTVTAGDAFIFELDANFLVNTVRMTPSYKPLPKYPSTHLDISVVVPAQRTVAELEKVIKNADKRITDVSLIDSFTRPEWKDQKSLTFRFIGQDPEGTLSKDDIDTIWASVAQKVRALGAEIR